MGIIMDVVKRNALVAQLDRVFDYESKGQGFESLRARQTTDTAFAVSFVFLCDRRDLNPERVEGERRIKNSPVDCF